MHAPRPVSCFCCISVVALHFEFVFCVCFCGDKDISTHKLLFKVLNFGNLPKHKLISCCSKFTSLFVVSASLLHRRCTMICSFQLDLHLVSDQSEWLSCSLFSSESRGESGGATQPDDSLKLKFLLQNLRVLIVDRGIKQADDGKVDSKKTLNSDKF